jgi:hypothetical protein
MSSKLFPTIMIVLSILAALSYIPCGDWRRVAYWLAAAILNASVTY